MVVLVPLPLTLTRPNFIIKPFGKVTLLVLLVVGVNPPPPSTYALILPCVAPAVSLVPSASSLISIPEAPTIDTAVGDATPPDTLAMTVWSACVAIFDKVTLAFNILAVPTAFVAS